MEKEREAKKKNPLACYLWPYRAFQISLFIRLIGRPAMLKRASPLFSDYKVRLNSPHLMIQTILHHLRLIRSLLPLLAPSSLFA
jgi:hypothetical protein